MPTVTEEVVGAGETYTTIQAAVDAVVSSISVGGADFVTNDEQVVLKCKAELFAERVVINEGLTCDATRNLVITFDTSAQHDGTWGNGARVQPSSGTGATFEVLDDFVAIVGLGIAAASAAAGPNQGVMVGDATHEVEGVLVDKCVIWGAGVTGFTNDGVTAQNWNIGTATNPIHVRDCTIWGWDRGGIFAKNGAFSGSDSHYWDITNCFFWDSSRGIGHTAQTAGSSIDFRLANNVWGNLGLGGEEYKQVGSGSGTVTVNSTPTDSVGEGGAGADPFPNSDGVSYTVTTSTAGGGDHIIVTATGGTDEVNFNALLVDNANNDVLNVGTGPSTNSRVGTTDQLGNARGGTDCDPGPHQISAVVTAGGVDPSLLQPNRAVRALLNR